MGAIVARILLGNQRQKRVENLFADHLSRFPDVQRHEIEGVKETFPDENLLLITSGMTPWYADTMNYFLKGMSHQN